MTNQTIAARRGIHSLVIGVAYDDDQPVDDNNWMYFHLGEFLSLLRIKPEDCERAIWEFENKPDKCHTESSIEENFTDVDDQATIPFRLAVAYPSRMGRN